MDLFYVIKPKTINYDSKMLDGIKECYPTAKQVFSIDDADTIILQKGYTRSHNAIEEYISIKGKKRCLEGYLFTDKYKVHLN